MQAYKEELLLLLFAPSHPVRSRCAICCAIGATTAQ